MIEHLQPPRAVTDIDFVRYSPYVQRPGDFGLTDVSPQPAYRTVYPHPAAMDALATSFEARFVSALDEPRLRTRFFKSVAVWRRNWKESSPAPCLRLRGLDCHSWLVEDTRSTATVRYTYLGSEQLRVLQCAAFPCCYEQVVANATVGRCETARTRELVQQLIDWRFLAPIEGRLLNLVCDKVLAAPETAAGSSCDNPTLDAVSGKG